MKKTLLPLILIVTLLSNITISYAQNQGNQPFWKKTGNNNISSENFVGTLNYQDLILKTDNIKRVIIQKNGLVLFKNKVIGEYPVRLKSKLTVDGIALFKDKATFNGIGHFKNKLIADDITRLKSKLIVDSNAVIKGKIRNNYLSGSGIVLLKADNNGVIKKFLFPGDSTKVLRGNGTYGSFSAGITGSENNTVYFNPEGKQQESDALTNDGTDIKVKNGLTVGERSGTTGAYSMVVGTSAPEYGLLAPEASSLAAFAHGSGTKATGIASFSTGVTTKATGTASFSIGINTIASGGSSFAGGHDDAGTNDYVIASGKGAFNFSSVSSSYTGVGVAAENSAILGGKNNSIDSLAENSGIFCGKNNTISGSHSLLYSPPMQTVIIGGENITATEPNTVYVPNLIVVGSEGKIKSRYIEIDSTIKVANSIRIDGINDRITSSSGTIGFGNTNLKEINKITADSINIGNIQITGQSIFDSLQVKNNLTVGERSGTTGAYSMVVGTSAPEYGLAAPEASNLGAFAQGSGTKATGIASFSTGVNTTASGDYSFSIGRNAIASGKASFAGGQDNVGTSNCVIASGGNAFNYSSVSNPYTGVGAAAKHSAILGGKDHSIDTACSNSGIFCGKNNTILSSLTHPVMRTVIIGGENITATESNTVYVPDLIAMGSITAENMNVTGQTVFDSLQVNNKIKIGNSIVLDSDFDPSGDQNSIYTNDISPLYIQSNDIDHNTLINAKNKGLVGIGTTEPTAKLNISGIVFGNDPKPLFRITENTTIISAPISSANIFEIKKKALTMEGWSDYYALTVADTGNVGIGTDNPHQRLHVNGYSYFNGKVGIGILYPKKNLHVNGDILLSGHDGIEGSIYFTDGPESEYSQTGEWAIEFIPVYEGNHSGLNFWKPYGSHYHLSGQTYELEGKYKFFIDDNGNVGIGTGTPSAKLTIVPGEKMAFNVVKEGNEKFHIRDDGYTWINNKLYVEHDADTSWAVTVINNANNGKGLLIKAGGNGKGIEIVNSDNNEPIFRVDISDQKTYMRGFKSTIQDFPDYVFDENYNLMPLKEKEKYWKQNKHLPGFPTAKQVKQEVDIPELIAKQMKEIEELYLYLIELKKENDELKQRIELLEQKK